MKAQSLTLAAPRIRAPYFFAASLQMYQPIAGNRCAPPADSNLPPRPPPGASIVRACRLPTLRESPKAAQGSVSGARVSCRMPPALPARLLDLPAGLLARVALHLERKDLGRLACCSRDLRGRTYRAWPADAEVLRLAARAGNLALLHAQLDARPGTTRELPGRGPGKASS